MKAPLVIGIGNVDRGDDGAGPHVCALLRQEGLGQEGLGQDGLGLPEAELGTDAGDPARILVRLQGRATVILIDAVVSGSAPGTIHEFAAHREEVPASLRSVSTHGFHPGQLVELARALGTLPEQLVVLGIEAESFELGAELSPAVQKACRDVAGRTRAILEQARQPEARHA